jgi:hypothetical protein
MPHAQIENQTPFVFESLFLSDEENRPLFVPLVQATFSIRRGETLFLSEKQSPIIVAGEFWGKPGESSYKYEPQVAFTKPATDVILMGSAQPANPYDTQVDVRLRLGRLDKTVHVTGDRFWVRTLGDISVSRPERFETMPLIYERAFGGLDCTHSDPSKHSFEPRNPVGTGYRLRGNFEDGVRLPNLEDPHQPIRDYGDAPPPAGFSFISPDWQPRVAFGGTFDQLWMRDRMPRLPVDFDRRFFNSAPADQILPNLKGNEPVRIENASKLGTLSFNLPGLQPPECTVQLAGRRDMRMQMSLDTVIINTNEDLVLLLWRAYLPVRNGPQDVLSVKLRAEGVSTTS